MQHQRHAHRFPRAARRVRVALPWPTAASTSPVTCEKLTPPRSSTAPSSIMREMPPPPSRARPFVAAERAAVDRLQTGDDPRLQVDEVGRRRGVDVHGVRSCEGASCTPLMRGRASARWPMSLSVLHAVEADLARPRRTRRAAPAARESPSAVTHSTRPPLDHDRSPSLSAVPGVEDLAVRVRGRRHALEAVDRVALARRVRIAARGEHDARAPRAGPIRLRRGRACRSLRARAARRGRISAAP